MKTMYEDDAEHTLEGFYNAVQSIGWSPEGTYLVVGDSGGQVVVYWVEP